MVATDANGVSARAGRATLPADAPRTPHGQVAWLLGVTPMGASTGNRDVAMTASFMPRIAARLIRPAVGVREFRRTAGRLQG